MTNEYCHGCNLRIAPQDPERRTFKKKNYHGKCLKQLFQEKTEGELLQVAVIMQPAGFRLRVN